MNTLPAISDPRAILKAVRERQGKTAPATLATPPKTLAGGGESNYATGSTGYENSSHSSHSSHPSVAARNSSREKTIDSSSIFFNNINELGCSVLPELERLEHADENQELTPARVARTARVFLTYCNHEKNGVFQAARVRLEQIGLPARVDASDDAEERAAIMEFDGGLERAEAEQQAGVVAALLPSVSSIETREQRRLHRARGTDGVPVEWIDGAMSLSLGRLPCPGFRDGQWARTYESIIEFLTGPLAAQAAGYGWSTELLFGTHPVVGLARVDCCGACILADRKPIIAVERDLIRFEQGTFYRPVSRNPSVPVWRFSR